MSDTDKFMMNRNNGIAVLRDRRRDFREACKRNDLRKQNPHLFILGVQLNGRGKKLKVESGSL